MSHRSERIATVLIPVGVIAGITLASILRGYLVAPSRSAFIVLGAIALAIIMGTYWLPIIPARLTQFLAGCALGILFVSAAVGR